MAGADGKVVLITGVGRAGQMGEALLRAFASDGARVAAVGHRLGDVETRVAELRDLADTAHAFACDLTDVAALDRLSSDVTTAFGAPLHALVHAAGGFDLSGPVAESDPVVWHRQLDMNLTAAYLTTRALLPALRAGRGAIVYFSSVAALPGASVASVAAYAAAKTGVLVLMRAVAAEERARGVRANAVAPAAIRTNANERSMGADARYIERDDVVAAVRWLCSDAARAITGQVIALT